ncbi:hypothetical protein E2562_012780 [Oryza meyeriana var. granulata]|uniref:Uncharacterized protein n=1 Tax=Oryza meyeriana var. granulata TaxID=110450 RepID=A0A6G1DHR8_9ORYZ|nr:hypothetical protein E2562_012780 [Oryza meyeriana var. granulata]
MPRRMALPVPIPLPASSHHVELARVRTAINVGGARAVPSRLRPPTTSPYCDLLSPTGPSTVHTPMPPTDRWEVSAPAILGTPDGPPVRRRTPPRL